MSHQMPNESEPPRGLTWPVQPVAVPFLYAWIAWSWWIEIRTQLEALPDVVPAGGVESMAAFAVAARVPALLSEAVVYHLWWRARGFRLPFWRFTSWVAMLSTIDVLGFSIRRAAGDDSEALRVLAAVFAGPGGPGGATAPASGIAAAFGSLGILTIVRIGMTAWAQARGIGYALGRPLLLTAGAWLVSRIIAWWSVDLLRGMSPLP